MPKVESKWRFPLIKELFVQAEDLQRWIIPRFVPFEGIVLVSGPRKLAFKTFWADFICCCVAFGVTEGVVAPLLTGPVMYIEEEGTHKGVKEKFRGFERTYGIDIENCPHFHYLLRGGVKLDEQAWLDRIISEVKRIKPLLVVIDALAYVHSVDENKTNEIAKVLKAIQTIRGSGAAVMFLAHTNTSGSEDKRKDADLGVRGNKLILDIYDSHHAMRRYSKRETDIGLEVRHREAPAGEYKVRWDIESEEDYEDPDELRILECRPHITPLDPEVAAQADRVVKLLANTRVKQEYSASDLQTAAGCSSARLPGVLRTVMGTGQFTEVAGRLKIYRRVK